MRAPQEDGPPAESGEECRRYAFEGGKRTRWFGRLFGLVWMFFLVYPLSSLFGSGASAGRVAVALSGTAVFMGVYLWLVFWHEPARAKLRPQELHRRKAAILALSTLALALTLAYGAGWIGLFIYASVAAGVMLPARSAYAFIGTLTTLTALLAWISGLGWVNVGQFVLLTGGVGASQILWVRLLATVTELREAREEVARLAVAEERLRFARDLHDLLGHSLSLITLKTDVISRLLPGDPERAAVEARDAEAVAREALREVRAAVLGYRRPSLPAELAAAREVLAAAGISCRVEDGGVRASATAEETLAWAVREGVTNVVRHSRARWCAIRLEEVNGGISLEVTDDGPGAHANPGTAGSGLAGIGERASAVGGRLEAGPEPGGGFRLRVTLPPDAGKTGWTGPVDVSAVGERRA